MNILVVEDSQFCSQLLESIAHEEGHYTALARNGMEALKMLVGIGSKYELIISDIFMPEMNGLELYKTLSQNETLSSIPIILTSNAADRNVIIQAGSLGCKHFLVKPLNAQKVRASITKIFPEHKAYLKVREVVMEEMHLAKEDYENLLRDFLSQAQTVYTACAAHAEMKMSASGLVSLTDGATLLGTAQLAADLKTNRENPEYRAEKNFIFVGDLLQQLQIALARIDAEQKAELDKAREASREKLKQEFEDARKRDEAAAGEVPAAPGATSEGPSGIVRQGRKSLADIKEIQLAAAAKTEAARESLLAAAKSGDLTAQFQVSMGYLRGRDGFMGDEMEGLRWLEMAAAKNYPDALCMLSLTKIQKCHNTNQGEWAQAENLMRNAAARGNKEAQHWVKEMAKGFKPGSESGISVVADAKQGNPTAQFKLGLLYDRGIEIPQNTPEAIYWLTHSAEQGHSNAQHRLGLIYESGRGGNDSYPLAVQWFEQAAEQGNVDAMLCLGRAYDTGLGVPKDEREAWRWFEAAAWKGNIRAQYCLGQLVEETQNMTVNLNEALKWYIVSGAGGYTLASRRADEVRAKLSPNQVKHAEYEAEQVLSSLASNNKVR